MTSNQLAYAANKIEQQKADEVERHDIAMEDENGRHNTVTEAIAERANELQEDRDTETARHNKAMEDIQSRYNETYLEIQRAQGEEKLRLQAELNQIELAKTEELNRHNVEVERLNDRELDIKQQQTDEIAEHDRNTEMLSADLNWIREQEQVIQAKRAENESIYWSGQLAATQLKLENEYALGQQTNWLRLYELRNDARLTNQRIKESEANITMGIFKTGAEIAKTAITGAIGLFAPAISGVKLLNNKGGK